MKKLKKWLFARFLPAWCKDELLKTNEHLMGVIAEQRMEIERLNAYIDGIQYALRRRSRITIRNEEGRVE